MPDPWYVVRMSAPRAVALAVIPLAVMIACGQREASTIERLEAALAAHAGGASEPSDEEIGALFARLDADVAAARADAAEARGEDRVTAEVYARDLERRRAQLTKAYLDAKIARFGDAAAETARDVGRKIGEGIEDAGRRIRESLGDDDAVPPTE